MSKRGRKEEIKQNVFFTKTGLDKDFVDTLADQVNVFVLNRGRFSTVEVRREEVLSLLEKLVFDGLLEEVINQQSTTLYTQKIYKPAKVNNPLCPLTCVPCGNCKLANKCFPDNPDCNPRICPYFNELLKYEDEDNEEEEEEFKIMLLFLLFFVSGFAENICLIQQSNEQTSYRRVLPGKHSTNCPCTNYDCILELMNCPTATTKITEPFGTFIAHCKSIQKKRKIQLTQEHMNTLNISDVHLLLPPQTSINSLTVSGTTAIRSNMTHITNFHSLSKSNVSISHCLQEDDHCLFAINKAIMDETEVFSIGEGQKVIIDDLQLTSVINPILQIGSLASLATKNVSFIGSWNIFVEGAISNALQGVVSAQNLVLDRPLELEYLDEIEDGSCIKMLSAKNLQDIPESMNFDLNSNALDFIQFPINKGILKHNNETQRYSLISNTCPADDENNTCVEYILIEMINKTKLIIPVELLDNEQFHFIINEGSFFGLKRVKKGSKSRTHFVSEFVIEKNKIKTDFITSQALDDDVDVDFLISDNESIVIPSRMFNSGYPFEHYQIWEMENQNFIIFTKDTKLSMPTFFTSGSHSIVRKKNSVSLC
ncbi:Uncharacterized protein QTN25_002104 [Entamoeba marina]